LLLRHCHTTRTLTSAGVCMRALTANRQPASVPESTITTDVHQSFDVELHLFPEVAFNHTLLINDGADAVDLFFAQLADAPINVNPCFTKDFVSAGASNAINISKSNFGSFICR